MFDKLVESSSTGAELGPRRRIFAATLVLVTTLFATAVVASIYAADFDLGASNFDIAELLTPVTETEPTRPEPERPRQNMAASRSDRPTRVMNIQRIDEPPITTPPVSTTRNPYLSRPPGDFIIDPRGVDSSGIPSVVEGRPEGSPSSQLPIGDSSADDSLAKVPPPAPPKIEKKTGPVSGGVMTGKATHLPRPTYSAAARSVGAQGTVTVQILVDEGGKVISAKALSGNPLLRPAAVEAAWKARFNPTTLTGVPVKVTGMISYNFVK